MVAPWNITQYQKARLLFLALTGGEQPVFVRDKKAYTRKDVVLSAANKDGGAHVDKPDANLQALQEGFWIRTVTHADGTKRTEPLADSHFGAAPLRRRVTFERRFTETGRLIENWAARPKLAGEDWSVVLPIHT